MAALDGACTACPPRVASTEPWAQTRIRKWRKRATGGYASAAYFSIIFSQLHMRAGADATASPTTEPTSVPTLSAVPTISMQPTTATYYWSHISWSQLTILIYFELVIGLAFLILFEVLRKKRQLYSPREIWLPHRAAEKRNLGLLGWVRPVVLLPGHATRALVGLDAYMLLRFTRLCLRNTLLMAFFGGFLCWFYGNEGTAGENGFNKYTVNNLDTATIEGRRRLWLPCGFNVFFTLHLMYLLDHEYRNYVAWRMEFMSGTDPDVPAQAKCTVILDNVPPSLQSNVALESYCDMVFPNEVSSANCMLSLGELESIHAERLKVVDQLERAVAHEMITGKKSEFTHYPSLLARLTCQGQRVEPVAFYARVLEELNGKVAKTQQGIHAVLEKEFEDRKNKGAVVQQGVAAAIAENSMKAAIDADNGRDGSARGGRRGRTDDGEGEEGAREAERSGAEEYRETSYLEDASNSCMEHLSAAKDDFAAVSGHLVSGLGNEIVGGVGAAHGGTTGTFDHIANTVGDFQSDEIKRTNVAFVSLKSELAASEMCLGNLTHEPYTLSVRMAPDPRDIIWKNITLSADNRNLRQYTFGFAWLLVATIWSLIAAVCAALGSSSSWLYTYLNVSENTLWYKYGTEYLPEAFQLGLLALVPVIVQAVAINFEGYQSLTEVQSVVMSRYFYFQIANIFVSISAGSFSTYFTKIIHDPDDIPKILADSFPLVGAYFIEFIVMKTFFGLFWELSRTWPATQYMVARFFTDRRKWTRRAMRSAFMSFPNFLYGWVYPSLMGVMCMAFCYSVITPVVSIFALLYFVMAELVYKNQALYVYINAAESGGILWNGVVKRIIWGLFFSHVLLLGVFLEANTYNPMYVMVGLLGLDIAFLVHCNWAYERPSNTIPLERAAEKARHEKQSLVKDAGAKEHWHDFSRQTYEQPALRSEPVGPEAYDGGEMAGVKMYTEDGVEETDAFMVSPVGPGALYDAANATDLGPAPP